VLVLRQAGSWVVGGRDCGGVNDGVSGWAYLPEALLATPHRLKTATSTSRRSRVRCTLGWAKLCLDKPLRATA